MELAHNASTDPHDFSVHATARNADTAASQGFTTHGPGLMLIWDAWVNLMAGLTTMTYHKSDVVCIVDRNTRDRTNLYHSSTMRAVANMLILGPSSIWTTGINRQLAPIKHSFMMLEFGKVVIQQKLPNNSSPGDLFHGRLGNMHAHMVQTLHEMGFNDSGKPINYAHLLDVFHREVNIEKMAQLLLEDVIMFADPDFQQAELVPLVVDEPSQDVSSLASASSSSAA